jgi:predicted porin
MGGLTGAVTYASGKVDKAAEGKADAGLMGLSLTYAHGSLSLGAGTSTTTVNVEAAAGTAGTCILNSFTTGNAATSTSAILAGAKCDATTQTRLTGADAVAAKETKDKQMYVGASYDLGVATVVANYRSGKSTTVATGVNSHNIRVTTFGVTVPMGAVTLAANMYTGKDSVAAAATDDGFKLKGNQISARYALSKRTFVYVATGRSEKNRDATNTTGATLKTKQTTAGLVHSF